MNLADIALYKQSRYKPGQTLRVPEVSGSQISRQSAHAGAKFVSSGFILQKIFLVLISVSHNAERCKIFLFLF
jgi:hypothetical protein